MANIFKKMKEHVTNADGSHSLVSKWTDSSTLIVGEKKDGSDLTLKESEITINYEDYKALEAAGELEPGIKYIVPDYPGGGSGGGASSASELSFDPSGTGLESTNVQDVIVEINGKPGFSGTHAQYEAAKSAGLIKEGMIICFTDDEEETELNASSVTYTTSSGAKTSVQNGMDQLNSDLTTLDIKNGSNGVKYVKMPNGLIIAWGTKNIATSTKSSLDNHYYGTINFEHGVPFNTIIGCSGESPLLAGYPYAGWVNANCTTTKFALGATGDSASGTPSVSFVAIGY